MHKFVIYQHLASLSVPTPVEKPNLNNVTSRGPCFKSRQTPSFVHLSVPVLCYDEMAEQSFGPKCPESGFLTETRHAVSLVTSY